MMKIIAILCLLGLILVYIGFGAFGLVMSAFCFDAGSNQAAWQCFAEINLAVIVPSLACILLGVVFLFMRRYKTAIAVAAVPAALAAILWLVLFVSSAGYAID